MTRIRYTAVALDDLAAIGDFIAADSRALARSVVLKLKTACRSLQTNSQRYAVQSRWTGKYVRRMPISAYLVFYQHIEDEVIILRVIHSARELDNLNLD